MKQRYDMSFYMVVNINGEFIEVEVPTPEPRDLTEDLKFIRLASKTAVDG